MFGFLQGSKPLLLWEENPCVNSSYIDSIDEYEDHDPWHIFPLQDQYINPLPQALLRLSSWCSSDTIDNFIAVAISLSS